jgi:hypothetical protein
VNVKLAANLIAEKARFHLDQAPPGSNLAQGLAEMAALAVRIRQATDQPPPV